MSTRTPLPSLALVLASVLATPLDLALAAVEAPRRPADGRALAPARRSAVKKTARPLKAGARFVGVPPDADDESDDATLARPEATLAPAPASDGPRSNRVATPLPDPPPVRPPGPVFHRRC